MDEVGEQLHERLVQAQHELESTRAVVGATRLRTVLRSSKAFDLTRAWRRWREAALESSAPAEPLTEDGAALQRLASSEAALLQSRAAQDALRLELKEAHLSRLAAEELSAERADAATSPASASTWLFFRRR
jgi:hypothetical protein